MGAYGGTVEASKFYLGDIPSNGEYAPGQVFVRFAPNPDGSQLSIQEKKQLLNSLLPGSSIIHNYIHIAGLTLVGLPPDMNVLNAVAILEQSEAVLYAEPNYAIPLASVKIR